MLIDTVKTTIVLFSLTSINVAAEAIYQWTDARGQIHFGDKSPPDIDSKTIILQSNTRRLIPASGLRPGERKRLEQLQQHQQRQQNRSRTSRTQADMQRASMRAKCKQQREMFDNATGRDTYKKHARYLRNNCW